MTTTDARPGPSLLPDRRASELRLEVRNMERTPLGFFQPEAETLDAAARGPRAKIRGWVSSAGRTLASPVTRTECVAYVVEARLVQHGEEPWFGRRSVFSFASFFGSQEQQYPPGETGLPTQVAHEDFMLDDGTHRARVSLAGAEMSLLATARTVSAGDYRSFVTSVTNAAFDHLTDLVFRELLIRPGEILTLYGHSQWEADPEGRLADDTPFRAVQGRCVFSASPSSPLYVLQEHVRDLDARS